MVFTGRVVGCGVVATIARRKNKSFKLLETCGLWTILVYLTISYPLLNIQLVIIHSLYAIIIMFKSFNVKLFFFFSSAKNVREHVKNNDDSLYYFD